MHTYMREGWCTTLTPQKLHIKIEYGNRVLYLHMLTIYDLTCATYLRYLHMQTIYYIAEVPIRAKNYMHINSEAYDTRLINKLYWSL